MAVYWITFRIADDDTYEERYTALVAAIKGAASKLWEETTSFILFESSQNMAGIAALTKSAIDNTQDLALIGMPDYKTATVVGVVYDQDLFGLMPFTKKV